jgi:hypothetical protein
MWMEESEGNRIILARVEEALKKDPERSVLAVLIA